MAIILNDYGDPIDAGDAADMVIGLREKVAELEAAISAAHNDSFSCASLPRVIPRLLT